MTTTTRFKVGDRVMVEPSRPGLPRSPGVVTRLSPENVEVDMEDRGRLWCLPTELERVTTLTT
jgi:hypothetical protein